ncbi:gliding motility-associated C-terminal domain-containing protein [uncultured Arcticibacterium sp.]|uniref:T9SS type B sorting domain-containing protein n=1 Tax=uncultured Arcticibacterium sp. TaxID=2173042 RepID=UPI0030F9B9D6
MGKNIKTKTYFSIVANIFVLMMICGSTHSQDLCNSSESIQDGFELLTPAVGCGPYTVKLEDKTGGSDIKYIYYYGGQDKSELDGLGPLNSLENTYFKPEETSNYTILQYGKKPNGEEFYSCKNVTVRVDNTPKFSYTLCNNNSLTIDIPKTNVNDFDYYEIEWGTGAKETVAKTELSFSKTKNVTVPVNINVEGFYTGLALSCGTPSPITINPTSAAGIDLEFHPNIDKIAMNTGNAGTITFSGALSGSGYEIYKTEKNTPYNTTPYLSNQQPGNIPFKIEDSTKSYCFYAIRNISCGIEQSAEICTIPFFTPTSTEQENILNWDEYKERQFDWPNQPIYGRFLETSTSIMVKENLSNISEVLVPNTPTEYYHTINCSNDYCYRIKVQTSGQLFRYKYEGESISNEICVSRKSFKPDSINNLFVSIENNSPIVKFRDDSGWLLNKDKYYLYSESNLVDSIDASQSSFNPDLDASSKSQCFQVQYLDECGSKSKLSPEVCSILLETDNASELFWEESFPFSPNSIAAYEIIAIDETDPNLRTSILSGTNFANGEHEPNLENNESEAQFIIRVITSSGLESYSNIATLPIESELFFPNTFSPTSNVIENKTFKVYGSLNALSSFEIKVYDRWGRIVFYSADPYFNWDGNYNGIALPSGTFTYSVEALNKRGEVLSYSGLINIIK